TCLVVRNATKRDDDFRRPSVWEYPRFGVPESIPFVENIDVVLNETFASGAQRVDLEQIAVAPCHARIEIDANEIVLVDLPISGLDMCSNFVGLVVERHERDVDVLIVVQNTHNR